MSLQKKRGGGTFGHRDIPTGRISCGDEDRDQGDTTTSQGMSNIAIKPPKSRREAQKILLCMSQKELTLLIS